MFSWFSWTVMFGMIFGLVSLFEMLYLVWFAMLHGIGGIRLVWKRRNSSNDQGERFQDWECKAMILVPFLVGWYLLRIILRNITGKSDWLGLLDLLCHQETTYMPSMKDWRVKVYLEEYFRRLSLGSISCKTPCTISSFKPMHLFTKLITELIIPWPKPDLGRI